VKIEEGGIAGGWVVIQALDVDRTEPWPDGPIAKKTKRYPSDLTDEEWEQIAPLMPKPGRRGRPREVDFREVINAVRYLVRSGCGWRMLPIHFGPWQTVYGWFRELARRFLFQTLHDVALMVDRARGQPLGRGDRQPVGQGSAS
jgi:transposase